MGNQPESKLSAKFRDLCLHRGAYVWKVHGNEFTPAGLPDLVGVLRGQFIGIETKMPGNTLSEVQKYRIQKLRASGALVLAPAFTVDEVKQFLDDVEAHLAGTNSFVHQKYGRGVHL